jgi:hypothetical protein
MSEIFDMLDGDITVGLLSDFFKDATKDIPLSPNVVSELSERLQIDFTKYSIDKESDTITLNVKDYNKMMNYVENSFTKEMKSITRDLDVSFIPAEIVEILGGKARTLSHFFVSMLLRYIYETIDNAPNIQPTDFDRINGKMPEKHSIPLQKLANELQHNIINNGAIDLIVANKDKKNEITTYVLATYTDLNGITISNRNNYTEFDRQIQDTVCSLWLYGDPERIFTVDMLFRAMTHKKKANPSQQQTEAIIQSLEKQRRIHVEVDATEEMKKRKARINGELIQKCQFDDFLLVLRPVTIKAGNKETKAYKITTEPVLLTYARMTNQLTTVSADLLDVKEVNKGKLTETSIANSDTRIAVKGYLMRRIAVINHDRKQSTIILFSTIFEETGVPNDSHSSNTKKYVFQVLDFFAAMGYIKGYTPRKSGNSYDAVIIDRQ